MKSRCPKSRAGSDKQRTEHMAATPRLLGILRLMYPHSSYHNTDWKVGGDLRGALLIDVQSLEIGPGLWFFGWGEFFFEYEEG